MNIVTQPYRRPDSPERDNFRVTMAQEFDLIQAVQKWNVQEDVVLGPFLHWHPTGRAHLWAVGTSTVARSVWPKMRYGDLVLFYGHSQIYAYGHVTAKVYWHNNNHIWPAGEGWDHIYALTGVTRIDPEHRPGTGSLREILPRFVPRAVQYHDLDVIGTGPADAVKAIFGSDSRAPVPNMTGRLTDPTTPTATDEELGHPATGTKFTGLNPNRSIFQQNWDAIERGNRGHAATLETLEQLVKAKHGGARYGSAKLNFDLLWRDGNRLHVCEVKSLTGTNQAAQIRLGIGQVLDFAHTTRLRAPADVVTPVLALETQPNDSEHWNAVCAAAGIVLVWPATMAARLGL